MLEHGNRRDQVEWLRGSEVLDLAAMESDARMALPVRVYEIGLEIDARHSIPTDIQQT